MEISVEPSKTYAVTTSGSCTVTDADGLELCTASSGSQAFFVATTPTVTISDDGAKVSRATFNYALAVAGLLGGGADKLPAGYRRVEYLLSNGKQRVHTDFYPTSQSGVEMDFCVTEETSASSWFFGNGDTGRNDEPDKKFSLLYAHDRTYPRGLFYLGGDVAQNQIFALAGTRQLLKVANGIVSAGNGSMTAPTANFIGVTELTICAHVRQANAMSVRWYGCKLYEAAIEQRNFVPAIDSTGTPCMFDLVSQQSFRNAGTGAFIAGVGTVAQLTALLRNLRATGGTLTLSLPAEANTPEVAEALQACHDTKGWTLTVHEYRPAATATYSLRRVREVVWCRREQSDLDSYVDTSGTRWQIERCAAIFGALGQDPAAYGYTPFDSVEQAAEHWALQPYVDPVAMDDSMGDNGTLEQGGTDNTSPVQNS